MAEESLVAVAVAVTVTASLPCFLYGAWVMIDAEIVTWDLLVYHLKFVGVGLVLTTVPMVGWMIPRLFDQLSGTAVVHAFFGVQAYALLTFALTGIVHILRAKRNADLYRDPDQDVDIDELHEDMSHWRTRLRVGVFGYTILWILAWLTGLYRLANLHLL
ncbi:DUF7321 family protein [Halopenitus persicus]|uniref:DUF7321 domain-containing protein n=1 Tax=Halopenitus persicus TaxID=1048396 RepID=A0A1H3IR95_9EURY|nr:hypothetical protein [Halopenitus persicus]QHS17242.1 hypothetical protein GWK26_08855 [haloarchaeon 3A1-DGR]SDY30211.1 hypothetical protein SAMN05216564_104230 [Halopenitus persicus]